MEPKGCQADLSTTMKIVQPCPEGFRLQKAEGAAPLLTYVNVLPDEDGTLRWENLFIEYQFDTCGNDVSGNGIIVINPGEGVYLNDERIPMNPEGRLLIDNCGSGFNFDHYAFFDVLNDTVKPETFQEKRVLVGGIAPILSNDLVTPVSSHFPGVERHATVISNILQQDFYSKAHLF